MEKHRVPVDREMNAIAAYDEAFPFVLAKDDLNECNSFVNWHKQPAVELCIICEGAINVNVLEREQTLTAGDGFIIMPSFLHSFRLASGYKTVKCITLIFHPEFLYGVRGSYYDKAYYRPIADCNTPLFIFSERDPWTREVFSKLKWVAEHYPDASPAFCLQTQHILQDVWALFAFNLLDQTKPSAAAHDTRKILNLVGYLHEHYQEKFSLAEMAESVAMSRNECCRYFKQMMNMTITEYLLEYRLSKVAALLESSDLRITEIAEQTGFCDVSYCIKMFRRKTGITPKAYAKNTVVNAQP